MNVGNLTAIAMAFAALATVAASLVYNRNQKRLQEAAEDERRAQSSDVNLVNINRAISQERDRAQQALTDQAKTHAEAIEQMRRHHQQEINDLRDRWEIDAAEMRRGLDAEASEMKQRYDQEMSSLATRLAECQRDLADCQQAQLALHRKLWGMQQLLPPNARPEPE